MADLYQLAELHKARLVAREARAAGDLVRAYALAYARVRDGAARLTSQIDERRVAGLEVSTSYLFERDRLTNLQREIIVEMNRFAGVASFRVASEQRAAAQVGASVARSLIVEASGNASVGIRLGALNPAAVESIAGFATDGSPLRQLFDAQGARVSQAVRDELISGVANGDGARVVASRIKRVFGGELGRALTVARTETIRAFRESQFLTYQESAAVLEGWSWQCSLSSRVCALCIAQHGRVFPVSQRLVSHPNCRCVPVPLVHGAPRPPTGAEWFAEQEPGFQKSILGAGKFDAFREGKIQLGDLVGQRTSPQWGPGLYERSLREVLLTSAAP